jgi:DeoR/GlpR family transcriptional regulator of sugar metabolism
MYLTITELASEFGCSPKTIERRVTEMEKSGMYPRAVMQVGKLRVNREEFTEYLIKKRRKKWKNEED